MNPEGTVYNAMGRINRLSVLCIDAYGVAVKNGFEGTVEEWLASLKGEKGDPGDSMEYVTVDDNMVASHAPADIYVKKANGYQVEVRISGSGLFATTKYYTLFDVSSIKATFIRADVGNDGNAVIEELTIDSDKNVTITTGTFSGSDSGGNVDQSGVANIYAGDYKRTPVYRCLNIYLDGDTTGMTKDDAVMLDLLILDEYGNTVFSGKSKTAWQGSGSLAYPNKNLSLKLRDRNDTDEKIKLSVFPEYATSTYHLKCNYADYSMVRNSVGSKMAMSFDDTVFPVDAPMVVNSVPAILYLNGEFNGCYTLNTKQDDDLFGMDTEKNPLTQIVYRSGLGSFVMSNFEYRSDGTETAEIQAKLKRLVDWCTNADDATFVGEFENYLSLRNAINYWIFADVACASDSMINNWTIATWDGFKWYMLWYDLDIIFGLFRNEGPAYHPSQPTSDLLNLQYTVANPIWRKLYNNFFDEIKERYWELRNSGELSPTAIVSKFRTFQSKWGTELIQKERAKWTGRLNKTDDISMMYGWLSERLEYLDAKYSNIVFVTNTLTNVSTSNEATTIDRGAPYTATLTVAAGHTMNRVTVTMGGVDITATAYSNGEISIPSATGNIVITAIALDNGTYYNITNALTNVTTNNSLTVIEEGTPYSATLTAKSGYQIDTVSVTMGGSDVTASVYSNGVVTIGSVTGDVVITANAVAEVVEETGPWKSGILTSNGTITGNNTGGMYYDEFIQVAPGSKIYLYNTAEGWFTDFTRVAFYSAASEDTFISYSGASGQNTLSSYTVYNYTVPSNAYYARICSGNMTEYNTTAVISTTAPEPELAYNDAVWCADGYLGAGGMVVSATNNKPMYTTLISVEPGATYRFANANGEWSTDFIRCCLYSDIVPNFVNNVTKNSGTFTYIDIVVPENAKYVSLSAGNMGDYYATATFEKIS